MQGTDRQATAGPVDRHLGVEDLTMAYGATVVQERITFTVKRGEILTIVGGSGCGKSTLLRHMIGLHRPAAGRVWFGDVSFWEVPAETRDDLMRRCGVLYQGGALWSSMTLAENVSLPLREYTDLSPREVRDVVAVKLALVGLAGFEEYLPADLSGGMRKRAGLARAMALDPDILFFDEPSSGLDPVTARRLDDLILELRRTLGTTIVIVTHDLDSIFAVSDNTVLLDTEARTMIAAGNPTALRDTSSDPRVTGFLTRGARQP